VLTYTLAFIPGIAALARREGVATASAVGIAIAAPHLLVDDGRLLRTYLLHAKGVREPIEPELAASVDQSLHMVCLWLASVMASAMSEG
jgi:hypothetical protein